MGRSGRKKRLSTVVSYSLLASILFHLIVLLYKIDNAPEKKKDALTRIKIIIQEEKQQVVETSQEGRKEPPTESRFVGQSDQNFDRQSVAQKVGSFKEAGKGRKDGSKAASRTSTKKRSQKVSVSELGVKPAPMESGSPTVSALGAEKGNAYAKGLAQTSDYVEYIPLGDVTNLNTMEYKYYGFYRRIRIRLEKHWGKGLRKKAALYYRKRGRFPASTTKITALVITLDKKGNIVRIKVKSTSGVKELDDVAIESFNKAGPFPNPPKGMIKNGYANIEWGFVVKG